MEALQGGHIPIWLERYRILSALGRGDNDAALRVALDHLPQRYGNALEWKYLEGLSVKEIAQRMEMERHVVDAIASLEEPFKTTLILRFYDDLQPKEIAVRMGVPAATVCRPRRCCCSVRRTSSSRAG